jgi:hypothetical protein
MISRTQELPKYSDRFLKACSEVLWRRRKAIRHHGSLSFSSDPDDSFEWFTVYYSSHNYPSVILQLVQGGRVSVFVRSNLRADRGRVLFRVEDVRTFATGEAVVKVWEWTIEKTQTADQGDSEIWKEIGRKWKEVTIKVVE